MHGKAKTKIRIDVMQQPHNHSKTFGAADFERYYNGKMTPHEMHLLEKAALEDPFLADALEGYAFTNTPVEDVAYLQQKLAEKEEQKVAPIAWWNKSIFKIAAIFLVVAISAALIYQLLQVAPNNIAKTESKNESNENIKDTTAIEPQNDTAYTAPAIAQKPFKNVTSKTKTNRQPSNEITRPVAARPTGNVLAYRKAIADKQEQEQLEKTQQESERQTMLKARTMAAPPPEFVDKAAGIFIERNFKGKVVDAGNKPIPFAIVSINGVNKATQADSNGNFTISSTDSALNVAVSSVGYESYHGILKSGDTNNTIALYSSTQSLNEVVVTGMGIKSDYEKETPPPVVHLKNAETLDRDISYQDYIESELSELKTAGFTKKGKIKLEFDLDKNGLPINIVVDKENCAACIEEAKRILSEGPALKKKNNRKKAKVTIYF